MGGRAVRDLAKKIDYLLCLHDGSYKKLTESLNSKAKQLAITDNKAKEFINEATIKNWHKGRITNITKLYTDYIPNFLGIDSDIFLDASAHIFFKHLVSTQDPSKIHTTLNAICNNIHDIQATGDALFISNIDHKLNRLKEFTQKAKSGELILELTDMQEIALELSKNINKSLMATTLSCNPIHESGIDTDYTNNIYNAIKESHVKVQRLFVFHDTKEETRIFRDRMMQDKDNGVDVKFLHTGNWVVTSTPFPIDLGVWDDNRVFIFSSDTNKYLFATLYNDTISLKEYKNVFNLNWNKGMRI